MKMKMTNSARKMNKVQKRQAAFRKMDNRTSFGATNGLLKTVSDWNKRFFAFVLAVVFVFSGLAVGFSLAIRAEGEDPVWTRAAMTPADISENGLVTSKAIRQENDGSYTLDLSAYAAGKVKRITEAIPTDYILVLDQSGSMAYKDMPTSYDNGTNKGWKITDITTDDDGNETGLYYKDEATGRYYRVYRKWGKMYEYIPPNTISVKEFRTNGRYSWLQPTSEQPQAANSMFYYRPFDDPDNTSTDENLYPLVITGTYHSSFPAWEAYAFSYTDSNDETHIMARPDDPWLFALGDGEIRPTDAGWQGWINLITPYLQQANDTTSYSYSNVIIAEMGMIIRQPMYLRHAGYNQLVYRDYDGVEHVLLDATYCDSNGTPVDGSGGSTTEPTWNGTLYRAADSTYRVEALKNALNSFVTEVANQTDDYGPVENRVAIVGFSSYSTNNGVNDIYKNTEVLTGTNLNLTTQAWPNTNAMHYAYDNQQHNGVQKPTADQNNNRTYNNALLYTSVPAERTRINNAINAVTAIGGTQPEYGFQMAEQIIDRRAITTYTSPAGNTYDRNKVVIFFTDGRPGNNDTVDRFTEANEVVSAARNLKADGVRIYSVGVFGEGDGNPLTRPEGTAATSTNRNRETAINGTIDERYFDPKYARSDVSVTGTYNYTATRNYYFRTYDYEADGYPEQPDDTITDYMVVTSSEYPDAKQFHSDNFGPGRQYITYSDMIVGERGAKDDSHRYYYNATDVRSLADVFKVIAQDVSEAANELDLSAAESLFRDIISDKFDIDGEPNVTISVVPGSQTDADSPVTFDTEEIPIDEDAPDELINHTWDASRKAVNVYGFDFNDQYIGVGHPGQKLHVVIEGLKPKEDGVLFSNDPDSSGIYQRSLPDDTITPFPEPSIKVQTYTVILDNESSDDEARAQDFPVRMWVEDEQGNDITGRYVPANQLDDNDQFITGLSDEEQTKIYYVLDGDIVKMNVSDSDDPRFINTLTRTDPDYDIDFYNADTDEGTATLTQPDNIVYVNSAYVHRDVLFHLEADSSPFVDTGYEFEVDLVLTGNDIVDQLSSINAANEGKITFQEGTGDFAGKLVGTLVMPVTGVENGEYVIPEIIIKVPDGSTLSVAHENEIYSETEIDHKDREDAVEDLVDYVEPILIDKDKDVYIFDHNYSDVITGSGAASDSMKNLIHLIARFGAILAASAGTVYIVFRRRGNAEVN